jgi:NADH:ubiquinone oxidoreductase subunit F (NADH-binding)
LLRATRPGAGPDLGAHLSAHGPLPELPRQAAALAEELVRAGLTGRGGAGFPTARKLELLARHSRPLLLANAMEGEPASAKDRVLLERAPHLVLDGAQVAASVVGAEAVMVCVAAEHQASGLAVERAIRERIHAGHDRIPCRLVRPPGRYLAGEESALTDWVGGGAGLPRFRPDKAVPLRVRRRPVLVQNAETLAHVALVARHGASWFRAAGLPDAPGTTLVTVTGAVPSPGVLEIELGTPLRVVLERAGYDTEPQAVLLGGYGGSWVPGSAVEVPYAPGPLSELGASPGAGVVGVLTGTACGVAETAGIVEFLAGERAGQCGPCTFGLPALCGDLQQLQRGSADGRLLDRLRTRLDAVNGRGACKLPDGAVRLVRSALDVFAADVRAHARGAPCPGWNRRSLLPLRRMWSPPATHGGRSPA